MSLTAAAVDALVERELAHFADATLKAALLKRRIPPRSELRPWQYQSGTTYECWLVAADEESGVAVAYCEQGFGPKAPWGLLWVNTVPRTGATQLHMGDDSGWFRTLEEAASEIL